MIFENTSLWRLKHLVSLPTYRRYINKCIYSIYVFIYLGLPSGLMSLLIHTFFTYLFLSSYNMMELFASFCNISSSLSLIE